MRSLRLVSPIFVFWDYTDYSLISPIVGELLIAWVNDLHPHQCWRRALPDLHLIKETYASGFFGLRRRPLKHQILLLCLNIRFFALILKHDN
jgi:hypothetical protein